MANTIKLRRSSTLDAVPSSLNEGELAANVNTGSPRVYVGLTDNSVVALANKSEADAKLPLAGGTMTGAIVAADQFITRPILKDYAVEAVAKGNTGASCTFDLEGGNYFTATLDQASTFTFSNPPASGDAGGFRMALTNGGAFTITWPASVDWDSGAPPDLTAAGLDLLDFTTSDGGTTWLGVLVALDVK